jgi:hypothetical protein
MIWPFKTIRSGSTYGTDAEPLGLPMNARQRRKYEAILADLRQKEEEAASAQSTANTIKHLKAYAELQQRRSTAQHENQS